MAALAVAGQARLGRVRPRAGPRRPVVHLRHAHHAATARAGSRSFSSSRAPMRSQKSRPGAATPTCWSCAHFVVVARTGTSFEAVRARLPELTPRFVHCDDPRRRRLPRGHPSLRFFWCTPTRPTCRPPRSAAGRRPASRSTAWCPTRLRRYIARASPVCLSARFAPRAVAAESWRPDCMTQPSPRPTRKTTAKTPRRRQPAAAAAGRCDSRVDAARARRGWTIVVLDLRKSDAFTDFFVIAPARTRGRSRRLPMRWRWHSRRGHVRPSHVEGYAARRVGAARLLRLRRPRVLAVGPRVLRARAPVGQPRERDRRSTTAAAARLSPRGRQPAMSRLARAATNRRAGADSSRRPARPAAAPWPAAARRRRLCGACWAALSPFTRAPLHPAAAIPLPPWRRPRAPSEPVRRAAAGERAGSGRARPPVGPARGHAPRDRPCAEIRPRACRWPRRWRR